MISAAHGVPVTHLFPHSANATDMVFHASYATPAPVEHSQWVRPKQGVARVREGHKGLAELWPAWSPCLRTARWLAFDPFPPMAIVSSLPLAVCEPHDAMAACEKPR
jgi:hypothetical protein